MQNAYRQVPNYTQQRNAKLITSLPVDVKMQMICEASEISLMRNGETGKCVHYPRPRVSSDPYRERRNMLPKNGTFSPAVQTDRC